MLTINMQTNNMLFKDIKKEDLQKVLELYNQNDNNIYATGTDLPMSLADINEKYLEVLVNSHEFFTGVFVEEAKEQFVGVIKGRIDYENNEEAWISSLLIDNQYQKQGLGKKTIEALIKLLNRDYDIKRIYIGVVAGNTIGIKFWQRLGFLYVRRIEQYIRLNSHSEDFIIMKKEIAEG